MKLFLRLFLAAALALAASARAATVTVFAAASLTESLQEIGAQYEKQSADKVIFNFAASSFLARQIEETAPADIFFSADNLKMDEVAAKGLIVANTRTNRLGNSLVIIVPAEGAARIDSSKDLTRPDVQHIALGDPQAVPAGVYSKAYLEKIGLWSAIAPKVVPTENVRGALAAVESENAEAGMVYKTDAAISKKVKVAYEIPRAEGPDISYPMAILKEAPQPEAAKRFFAWLESEKAADIFRRHGFLVLKP